MAKRAPSIRRGVLERLAAWLVTGPVGHLYSVAADLTVFAARSISTRVRSRVGALR